MTNDLRAAAELAEALPAYFLDGEYDGIESPMVVDAELVKSARRLARHILQSPPQAERADDGEAITSEWLESVGFIPGTLFVYRLPGLWGESYFSGSDFYWKPHPNPAANYAIGTDRKAVRNLCKALGVSLGGEKADA